MSSSPISQRQAQPSVIGDRSAGIGSGPARSRSAAAAPAFTLPKAEAKTASSRASLSSDAATGPAHRDRPAVASGSTESEGAAGPIAAMTPAATPPLSSPPGQAAGTALDASPPLESETASRPLALGVPVAPGATVPQGSRPTRNDQAFEVTSQAGVTGADSGPEAPTSPEEAVGHARRRDGRCRGTGPNGAARSKGAPVFSRTPGWRPDAKDRG